MTKGGIYILRCPITRQVRYVGQATSFSTRRATYRRCEGSNRLLSEWLESLHNAGQPAIFEPLLITSDKRKKDIVERRLIAVYGSALLNVRTGGTARSWTVPHLEEKQAQLRSQAMRDWWARRRSSLNNPVNH